MKPLTRCTYSAIGLVLFLGLWELCCRCGWLNAALIPAPSHLPRVLVTEIESGEWLKALGSSMQHYLIGVVVGAFLGIAVGLLVALSEPFAAFQEWTARLLRPIPPIAWIPFAIVWFGITHTAAAFMIAIGVFWLNYFATLSAVMSVERNYFELAQAYRHVGFWDKLMNIILPAASPGILSGVRSGFGQGWMLVVAAELFGIAGMGQRMMEAAGLLATDIVVVYMFTIAVVYSVTDWIFVLIENKILRWQRVH
jgi:ABC-type nitrate/sulfonate/bicarbonate transport system permease component